MHDLTHIHFCGLSRPVSPAPRRPELPSGTLGPLAEYVLTRAGLDPLDYRLGPLSRRVPACMRALGVSSEPAGIACLEQSPERLSAALDALLIGVSAFFRDPPVFDVFRATVLPALRERPGTLRIWSVGCSNGAELYSVAVLLAESGLLDRSWLLGTDCRGEAIAAAQQGWFAANVLAGLDPSLIAASFDADRGGWRVKAALRRRTRWQRSDATRDLVDGPWDVVLCRNVVIYLQPRATHALFAGLHARLSPGGFLVVGKAERPAVFGLVPSGRDTYRRRDD